VFKDPYRLVGVRDLPDPTESVSDAERDLFGIVDGQHTVEEVVRLAPLSEHETYETLHRMLEAKWIELSGRREPGEAAKASSRAATLRTGPKRPVLWELVVLIAVVAFLFVARHAGRPLVASPPPSASSDVFAAARLRNLRAALELYRRENGGYPDRIEEMVEGHWITPDQAQVSGYVLDYLPPRRGADYRLELKLEH